MSMTLRWEGGVPPPDTGPDFGFHNSQNDARPPLKVLFATSFDADRKQHVHSYAFDKPNKTEP
jgi:hypothetical protein